MERYLRRQQRRAELEQKRHDKSTVSESVSSTAISANASGARIFFIPDVKDLYIVFNNIYGVLCECNEA